MKNQIGNLYNKALKYSPLNYKRGRNLYKKYLSKYDFLVILNNGIGEGVFTCSYLKEFKTVNNLDCVTVLARKPINQVAMLFESVDKVICVEKKELDCISFYLNDKSFHEYHAVNSIWNNRRTINIYKQCWLGPNNKNGWVIPKFYCSYLELTNLRSIENPRISEINEFYIEKYKLKQGNSVVFIPDANTYPMMPDIFWNKLSLFFRSYGYKVFLNTDRSHSIENDGIILPEIKDVASIINYCGYAITIQCGLSDLLEASGCKNVYVIQTGDAESKYRKRNDENAPFSIEFLYNSTPNLWKETLTKITGDISKKLLKR